MCDRIGRINATRFLCTLWIVGIIIFMVGGVNGNLGSIYAGRFIAGLGVGQTPVVGYVLVQIEVLYNMLTSFTVLFILLK